MPEYNLSFPFGFTNGIQDPTASFRTRLPVYQDSSQSLFLFGGVAATAPFSEPDWQEGAVAAGWQALTSLHDRAMRG